MHLKRAQLNVNNNNNSCFDSKFAMQLRERFSRQRTEFTSTQFQMNLQLQTVAIHVLNQIYILMQTLHFNFFWIYLPPASPAHCLVPSSSCNVIIVLIIA